MALEESPIYLIDGSSYIHRAYHAMGGLSNSKGFPTGAVFGFTNMIVKALKEKDPKRIAVIFDAKGTNYRHELYPAYKANRPPMSEDLKRQIPKIEEVVAAYRLPALCIPGFEADDIIATLTRQATLRGLQVMIVSADKDLMQLVGKGVSMWDPQRDIIYDPDNVKTKFGVLPDSLLDFMALTGDSSDNIPGVSGIGPKTASTLIQQFASLENLYENVERIPQQKLRDKISTNREKAFLSRELVRLNDKVPLDKDVEDLVREEPDTNSLRQIFQELEFKRLAMELPSAKSLDFSGYVTISTMRDLQGWITRIRDLNQCSVDVETTSQEPMRADLVGISLCPEDGQACYIPLGHVSGNQLARKEVLDVLRPLLEDSNLPKVGQNIKYDMIVFQKEGIELKGIKCDTMLASYLLDPSRRGHSLDDLAQIFLDHQMIPIKELIGTGKNQIPFSRVDIRKAAEYSCEDADATLRIASILCPRLEEEGLGDLFRNIELPLIPILVDMEMAGVLVDVSYLNQLSGEFGHLLGEIEAEIHSLAGECFNINSPKQLSEVLFDHMGMKPSRKTKTGPSTSLDVLEELAVQHELPRKILEYRSIFKLRSTYVDALVNLVNPDTGRIHTSYNQAVAATGRLSSSNPNLQNIPIRTPEGRKVRKAFIPNQGHLFVAADYSQIELRVVAHLSGDNRLQEAFFSGDDIHSITAASIFECSPAHVTPEMRRKAKEINFGIIYGMGPFKLATQIGVGLKMARQYLQEYYGTYSGVRSFMEELPIRAAKEGFVTTILGRKRFLPDLNNPNKIAQQAARRIAINTTIQGSAADIIKLAMIRLHKTLHDNNVPAKMILQVHDELILEVHEDFAQESASLMKNEMERVYPLSVPLVVDVAVGRNWEEAH